MCFSPAASFASAAVLSVIGVATLAKAAGERERFFASVPLLFACHQLTEGLLWLSLLHEEQGLFRHLLTQAYVFFAGVLWTTLIPYGLIQIEGNLMRRRLMLVPLLLGSGIAFYALYTILQFGVTAEIGRACIVYNDPARLFSIGGISFAYVAATCLPFLLSGSRAINTLGILNIIAFIATLTIYRVNYASVWCFFAALISGGIYYHFRRLRRVARSEPSTAFLW